MIPDACSRCGRWHSRSVPCALAPAVGPRLEDWRRLAEADAEEAANLIRFRQRRALGS